MESISKISFHEIFPDGIQAKIVSFILTKETHQGFPCISKSFKQLFINFPALYDDVKFSSYYFNIRAQDMPYAIHMYSTPYLSSTKKLFVHRTNPKNPKDLLP